MPRHGSRSTTSDSVDCVSERDLQQVQREPEGVYDGLIPRVPGENGGVIVPELTERGQPFGRECGFKRRDGNGRRG